MLTYRIKRLNRVEWRRRNLGYEQRVARTMEFSAPLGKTREVDIWRQEINFWSPGAPNVHDMKQWTSAGILTRLIHWTDQRSVDKHGQRVFGFTEFGDSIYVTRKVPGHENFICSWSLAKDFLPSAVGLKTVCSPYRWEFGNKVILVLLQIVHQLDGYRLTEKLVRDVAAVP